MAHKLYYDIPVGDQMKGLVIDGSLVAWDVNQYGYPEHDTFDEDGVRDLQIANFATRINHISVVGSGPPIRSIQDILGLFSDYNNNTKIEVGMYANGMSRGSFDFKGTVGSLREFFKHSQPPDPDDYDDGIRDADFTVDYNTWTKSVRTKKAVRQILGRGGRDDVWQERDEDYSKSFSVYNPKRKKKHR